MADSDKGTQAQVSEVWDLILRYAKQETVEPLKGLIRFIGLGLAGAVLVAIGAVLLAIGILRAVQEETGPHLSGHLSWVPYVAVMVFAVVVAGLAVRAIGAEKRQASRDRLALERRS